MAEISYELPEKGEARSSSDGKVRTGLSKLKELVNGKIDNTNLSGAAEISRANLKAESKPVTWSTPKAIATEQTRENVAFGTLATADEITGIALPAGGFIEVGFLALVKSSVAGAGRVGLFLGSNGILSPNGAGEVATSGTGYFAFATATAPEQSPIVRFTSTTLPTPIATGTVRVYVATPGTYALSVQYKATSGAITAKERVLWAEVHGF